MEYQLLLDYVPLSNDRIKELYTEIVNDTQKPKSFLDVITGIFTKSLS
jgi:hypothetical protein